MQLSEYTRATTQDIFNKFSTRISGLTEKEIGQKQQEFGKNELSVKELHWWDILFRQFQSPFLYLLIGAAFLALFLGEVLEGTMILIFVAINTFLGFYQEYRSDKTLKLLRQYIVAKAKVMRSGKEVMVNYPDLVPGDIVILEPGDIVPADIRLVEANDLLIDESVLTGESISVRKNAHTIMKPVTQLYQAENMCFSGTTIMRGEGLGVITAIGKHTAMGTISKLTVETKHESSFEKGIGRFSKFILQIVISTLTILMVINFALKGSNADIPTLLIFSIALAVSVIPEALPVVTTFCLSRGALYLAKHHVIVKRLSAIEDLGSIEIFCTDKTGTITENKLSVQNTFPIKSPALLYASLATELLEQTTNPTDVFDIAVLQALESEDKKLFKTFKRLKEIPFDPKRKRNCVLVQSKSGYELIVRGAAETILNLCTTVPQKEQIEKWIREQGEQGNRVLAIAKRKISAHDADKIEKFEKDLTFVGCVSFIDPLKKTAPDAIAKAKLLGVQIKILTGDSREVAGNIAYKIGLVSDAKQVITGDELDKLSPHAQFDAVQNFAVFARVSPEQKHKIVTFLKKTHEVGFIGDGINDAPALKAANVAMAVDSASNIAKDSADIILLTKSLHVIVEGIKEGRQIFANTAKYIKATLASNFGNFYTVAIASLFIPFLPLLPLQILFLNLLTDFPMIAVATDTVDKQELKSPRNYDVREIALLATILGCVSSFFDFIFFVLFSHGSPALLQTSWFIASALTEIVFIYSIRTRGFALQAKRPSLLLIGLSIMAFCTAIILPFTGIGHELFHFITPSTRSLMIILSLVAMYFFCSEAVKILYYSYLAKPVETKKHLA